MDAFPAFDPDRITLHQRPDPTCNCGRTHDYYRYPLSQDAFLESAPMMEVTSAMRAQMAQQDLAYRYERLVQSLSAHQRVAILQGGVWPDEPPLPVPDDNNRILHGSEDILDLLDWFDEPTP